jgi:hypothetical protein
MLDAIMLSRCLPTIAALTPPEHEVVLCDENVEPLASLCPEELRGRVDVLFLDEAEYTWPRFLREYGTGHWQPEYRQDDKPSMLDFALASLRPAQGRSLSHPDDPVRAGLSLHLRVLHLAAPRDAHPGDQDVPPGRVTGSSPSAECRRSPM